MKLSTCPTVLFYTCSNADNDNDDEPLLVPVIEDIYTEKMDGDEESEVI